LTVTEFSAVAMRVLLAAVFLIAGVAKLANRGETAQILRDFGAPRLLQPFGVLLAPLEVAVALGLLFAATSWYAAWAALLLLTLFIVGIGANLARGHQPPCNCFGQLHSRPISWRTLVRNGVLAAAALYLLVSGPPPASADLLALLASLSSGGRRIAIVVAAIISFAILRALWPDEPTTESADSDDAPEPAPSVQTPTPATPAPAAVTPAHAESALTGIGLAVGTSAPLFILPDLDGQLHSLDSFLAFGQPLLLVFSSPYCESCQVLLPRLPAMIAAHGDALRVVLISKGTAQQNLAKMKEPTTFPVLLQEEFEVAEAFDCTSTPAALVISADGVIQSLLAVGGPAIAQLLASDVVAQAIGHSARGKGSLGAGGSGLRAGS
jgi:peroxiredoxin